MSGALNLIMANGGGSSNNRVTVGRSSSTNPGNGNTFDWLGWTTVIASGTTGFLYYPDTAVGSISTTPYIVNGLTVIGVMSRSAANGTGDAQYYYVYVSGNNLTGINSLTINGTTMSSPSSTFDLLGNPSNTRFVFSRVDAVSLFGTTVGAQVSIYIS
jgi:hypothetical protein